MKFTAIFGAILAAITPNPNIIPTLKIGLIELIIILLYISIPANVDTTVCNPPENRDAKNIVLMVESFMKFLNSFFSFLI